MVYRYKTIRWAMAWVMALWVPAWCCCAIQAVFAKPADAHASQSVLAGESACCSKSSAEQDSPTPSPAGPHSKDCQCDQHLAVATPTTEVQPLSGVTDQLHPAVDLLLTQFAGGLLNPISLATASQPDAPGIPCADSLLTRHCLLTI